MIDELQLSNSDKNKFYKNLEEIMMVASEGIRAPERLTVDQAAEKYRKLNNQGSYVGPWRNSVTPYLVEPMKVLTSDKYTGMIFAGPAQCGKTDMVLNWLLHTAKCEPADFMLVQTSKSVAEDFSKRKVFRLLRDSPEVGNLVMPGKQNIGLKKIAFKSGMVFSMAWPTAKELSGKTIRKVWLTDYDRMDMDVDGEGSPYLLAKKRTTTFKQYGMTVAESSPGFDIEDLKWIPKTNHYAPPTQGVLALYNNGDRRRWYWPCPKCENYFEPDFSLLTWEEHDDISASAKTVQLECPHCSHRMNHEPSDSPLQPGKHRLNQRGVWIADGQYIDKEGQIKGDTYETDIASFWLKGVAAAFSSWQGLVSSYLKALEEFETTGAEEALKTTTNVDQGLPYKPKRFEMDRLPEYLKNRSKDYGYKKVPIGGRFLIANVDVQKHSFEVQVHAVGVHGETWVIDRFSINKSNRVDAEGDRELLQPGSYFEDWLILINDVFEKTYPLADNSDRYMQLKAVTVDSAGESGVTKHAYEFYTYLKYKHKDNPSLYKRFLLTKGGSSKTAPRIRINYPDTEKKDKNSLAKGEIPVLMINMHEVKNIVDKLLDREEDGPGKIHFASWLPDSFYEELTAERKTSKGWETLGRKRNESWDLLCYCYAACLCPALVGIEKIDWLSPPSWADEWDNNTLISDKEGEKKFDNNSKKDYTIKELGAILMQ